MDLPLRAVVLLALMASTLSAETWYVSPTGSDESPGTEQRPFATLLAARDAARRVDGRERTIYLRAGTYYLSEPLVLTPQDSGSPSAGVTYQAIAGEEVVISGGERLQLAWQPFRDGILQAKVGEGLTFDQLFVNGQRQPRARFPNYDRAAQYFQGSSADCTRPDRVQRWQNPVGGFLHAMHGSLWGDMHWAIAGKTEEGQLQLVGGWQNNRQTAAHKDYRFVENIFEELDAPGEWYLNERTATLYFFPPANLDLAAATFEAVRLAHLVEFRGTAEQPVHNVTLQGLTFTHTRHTFMQNREPLLRSDWTTYRGGAIVFDGTEQCSVRDCRLLQVGGNAVFVNNYNRGCEITGCHIADAGASAISFVGDPAALRSPLFEYRQTQDLESMDKLPGPKTNNFPAECLVEDCLIYRNGRVEKQTAGVNVCMSGSITIRHCSIYDCPRAGINICDGAFGGHLIEFNDVFDTVKETGDHGSFNSWGRDRFWHPDRRQTEAWVDQFPEMPRWDCQQPIVLRNNRWRCDHGWDIDLDDGSSNYELTNNLCLAGGIKLREGYFRQVTNNLMVDYTFCPHVWYANCNTTFMHNILWRDEYAPAGMERTDQQAGVDYNFVHRPGAAAQPATKLQAFGGDAHSLVGDALFVDPLAGDYRVRDDSPAISLGWKNFPMDKFGVQKPELKRLAKRPPLPGSLEAAAISSGGWGRHYGKPASAVWLGARVKQIENAGEMSAVGLGDRKGVLIASVPPSSPAAQQGLQPLDVVRGVNGQAVQDLGEFAATVGQNAATGQEFRLSIWRNQAELELTVSNSVRE